MENTPTITIPRKEAKLIYKDYLAVVKTRKEKYLQELKQVYSHLSRGHKVLDIFEVFKTTGVDKKGEPKLAIALADQREVFFLKETGGAGLFSKTDRTWGEVKADVRLPNSTFPKWRCHRVSDRWNTKRWEIVRQTIKTKVPIVPAHLLPEGRLDNYYILWEVVEGWKEMPVVKDPFLLKRINANAFVVLAEWDLTEVEQAIIRGR